MSCGWLAFVNTVTLDVSHSVENDCREARS
jgi:hypothetical protein